MRVKRTHGPNRAAQRPEASNEWSGRAAGGSERELGPKPESVGWVEGLGLPLVDNHLGLEHLAGVYGLAIVNAAGQGGSRAEVVEQLALGIGLGQLLG